MAEFLALPSELINRIFDFADTQSRKTLRLVNSLLYQIGIPFVFRTVTISPTQESWDAIGNIFDRRELADSVVKRLVDRLSELSRLQSVALRSYFECKGDIDFDEIDSDDWNALQSMEFRSRVLKKALAMLASLPRSLLELDMQNFQNINPADASVVADLTKGSLFDVQRSEARKFFLNLPSFWLKPTASNLERLHLQSDLYFGFYPKCDLSGVHFPRLKVPSLYAYTFVHDPQLDWILSHKDTLQELYLKHCTILFEVAIPHPAHTLLDPRDFKRHLRYVDNWYASYEIRWHHYFRAFSEGLPPLRQFEFNQNRTLIHDDYLPPPLKMMGCIDHIFHKSYQVYCDGVLGNQIRDRLHYDIGPNYQASGKVLGPSEEDAAAMKELMARLEQS
ncbi:uncharacterized protein BDV14DRAFT_197455 [Aspergillus stella-maris]|uniref:uncharacterized protein n=1 Tax=Aspergillus stella-maris TaxID=1810926 RepID=UPI003CCC996C